MWDAAQNLSRRARRRPWWFCVRENLRGVCVCSGGGRGRFFSRFLRPCCYSLCCCLLRLPGRLLPLQLLVPMPLLLSLMLLLLLLEGW